MSAAVRTGTLIGILALSACSGEVSPIGVEEPIVVHGAELRRGQDLPGAADIEEGPRVSAIETTGGIWAQGQLDRTLQGLDGVFHVAGPAEYCPQIDQGLDVAGVKFDCPLKKAGGFRQVTEGDQRHSQIEVAIRELFGQFLPLLVRTSAGKLPLDHFAVQFHVASIIVVKPPIAKSTCHRAHQ